MSSMDVSGMVSALKNLRLTTKELLDIEGAGAKILINGMRMRVAKDTHATENSINSHYEVEGEDRIVDEIGPETEYGPYLEYGTGEYNEEGKGRKTPWRYRDSNGNWHYTEGMRPQPFVRPTMKEDGDAAIAAMQAAFNETLRRKWPR